MDLTLNKEYEVVEIKNGYAFIIDDSNEIGFYFIERFKIIKEDKMEEVRVIRKLEELNGLENGMGLVLKIEDNKFKIIYRQTGDLIRNLIIADCHVPIIKAMGFKFEFQKLRTVEEVLEEMKKNSLSPYHDYGKDIYEVRYIFDTEKDKRAYSVIENGLSITLGAYIFEFVTAQKYADELNEIVGGRKMIKTNIKDMKILEVKTKDFVDINDFLRKNYFQLFFNRRNILTLLYVFQEGKESFFIKKSQVYINVHMEFIDNREGVSYLKRDYIDYEEGMVSAEIQPLNYYIDYEWEAK